MEDQLDLEEGQLARFSHLVTDNANPDVKFDSLSIMVSKWAKLFLEGKMGLTTPVAVKELVKPTDGGEVADSSGVQLLFQKKGMKTGGYMAYQDKDDEKLKDKGDKKDEAVSEGGVEVRVERLSGSDDLRVVATRCEIEEGTIVKEMSEQTIIESLGKAMAAWKKEQES